MRRTQLPGFMRDGGGQFCHFPLCGRCERMGHTLITASEPSCLESRDGEVSHLPLSVTSSGVTDKTPDVTQHLLGKSGLASENAPAVTSPSSINLSQEAAANMGSFFLRAGPRLKVKLGSREGTEGFWV